MERWFDDEFGAQWVKGILRSEMVKRGITYAELAERLNALGLSETEKNLANKIGRGTFSAALFLQCLYAIGMTELSFNPRTITIRNKKRFKRGDYILTEKEMTKYDKD